MRYLMGTVALCFVLSGCASVGSAYNSVKQAMPWYRANDVDSIAVYVAPDASLRFAIAIDAVFVFDDMTLTVVKGLNSQQWFEQKNEILAKYHSALNVLNWTVVSGLGNSTKPLPNNHKEAIAVLAFANFPSNPNALVEITEIQTPWLVFENGQLRAENNRPDDQSTSEQGAAQ